MTLGKAFLYAAIFVFLLLVSIALRDSIVLDDLKNLLNGMNNSTASRLLSPTSAALSMNLRVGSGYFIALVQLLFVGFAKLVGLYQWTEPYAITIDQKINFLALCTDITVRAVYLAPLLMFAIYRFVVPTLAIPFILTCFLTLCGWGVKNDEFMMYIVFYDYASIGFLYLFFYLLANRVKLSTIQIASLMLIAQIHFENLGLVFIFAMAILQFFYDSDPLKEKIKKMTRFCAFYCFISACAVLLMMVLLQSFTEFNYFAKPWDLLGENAPVPNIFKVNFWVLIYNTLIVTALPISCGFLIGLYAARKIEDWINLDYKTILYNLHIAWIISGLFFCCLAIKATVIGFGSTSEFGRQSLPLNVFTVILGFYVGIWANWKLKNRAMVAAV